LMLADGLTKPLLNGAFDSFVEQSGLIDISEQLDERRRIEREAETRWDQRQPDTWTWRTCWILTMGPPTDGNRPRKTHQIGPGRQIWGVIYVGNDE